jgi:acetate kinase
VVDGLDGLGFRLDAELNDAASKAARLISADASPIKIAVVPTNEELAIARETAALLEARSD